MRLAAICSSGRRILCIRYKMQRKEEVMNFKNAYKRGLALFLSLLLALSLAVPGLAAGEETKPLPELGEEATDPDKLNDPYDGIYKEATEAGAEGTGAVTDANEKIDSIQTDANEKIEGIGNQAESSIEEETSNIDTANAAINEAVENANQQKQTAEDALKTAQDENATLEERHAAANAAEVAAGEALKQAQAADEALKQADAALKAAEQAVKDAQAAYEQAVEEAKAAVGTEQGNAEEAVKEAKAKLAEVQEVLNTTASTREGLETVREGAWDAARSAEALANKAAEAAKGKDKVISDIKDTYGQGIADAKQDDLKDQVNTATGADETLTKAENVEEAANDVVNAWAAKDDLEAIKDLADDKAALDTAKAELDAQKEATKNATSSAVGKTDRDNYPGTLEGKNSIGSWMTKSFLIGTDTILYRNAIDYYLTGTCGTPDIARRVFEKDPNLIDKIIAAAENPEIGGRDDTFIGESKEYVKGIGTQLSAVKAARAAEIEKQSILDATLAELGTKYDQTAGDASAVSEYLKGQIDRKNPEGKYDLGENYANVGKALEDAQNALTQAKDKYAEAKGDEATLETRDAAEQAKNDAAQAVTEAKTAYESAIKELNKTLQKDTLTAAEREKNKTILDELVTKKEALDNAQELINKAVEAKQTWDTKEAEYTRAKDASQKAHSDYLTAKGAVDKAGEALANAKANGASFKELKNLQTALDAAKAKFDEADTAKKDADNARDAAKDAADEAREAADEAQRRADEAIEDLDPGTGGTDPGTTIPDPDVPLADGTGADGAVTLEDQAVPLAGLISRQVLVSYLYAHEGSPDGVDAEGEYTLALAWAVTNDIVDEEDDPEEVVTVAILRDVMTRYAKLLGVVFDVEIEGEDDMIVMNCDEILAAFYARLEDLAA